jgi:hypothetical protein
VTLSSVTSVMAILFRSVFVPEDERLATLTTRVRIFLGEGRPLRPLLTYPHVPLLPDMLDALNITEADAVGLAELAAEDLAMAKDFAARARAAEDPAVANDFARSYQRMARSYRQTLALKVRLKRELAQAEALARRAYAEPDVSPEDPGDLDVALRAVDLQDATGRIAQAAIADEVEREARLDRFDRELDDWVEEDDFLTADLDEQVRRACRVMDLPETLARTWRALPPLTFDEDADADDTPEPTAALAPGPPWRGSG